MFYYLYGIAEEQRAIDKLVSAHLERDQRKRKENRPRNV